MMCEGEGEAEAPEGVVGLHSAGGVVVRGEGRSARVAVMRSVYGTWVFPKGGVRLEEEPEDAARREVAEEIGLRDLRLVGPVGRTEHEFEKEASRFHKRVDWFLFRAPQGAGLRPDASEGALDCGWFSPRQALSLLSHADQKRLLRKALGGLARAGTDRSSG
jgi:8-oxo-dGTP pyrophosphatase MutT (NUDIX family)